MAVFTWQSGSTGTGTFNVVTRSGSYTSTSQLIARNGTYSIDTQVSLRSGSVTLYQQGIGYVTSPMTAFDIVFERSILSPIINTPFNNNVYNTSAYKLSNKTSGSGSINVSDLASAKVAFNPAGGTGLFKFVGPLTSQSTTQYDHNTNNLANAGKYALQSVSVTSATSIPNPITGLTGDSAIFNTVVLSPSITGYITPTSSTGTFAANTVVVVSIFAKANTFNKFTILGYADKIGNGNLSENPCVEFNLTSGTATDSSPNNPTLSYGIIPYSNGWYRCWVKQYLNVASDQSTGAGWFQLRFNNATTNDSVYFYGPQLQKDVLTTYVENTGTTALTTTAYLEYPVTSTSFKPPAGSGTINVSGTARITSPYIVSGSVTLSGSLTENRTSILPAGSGTINASNQASAKVTFDSADGTGLFTFSNGYSNLKATSSVSYLGSNTNSLTLTESFQDSDWVRTGGVGIFTDTATAPDGTTTADLMVEDSGTSSHWISYFYSIFGSNTYTISIFAKQYDGARYLKFSGFGLDAASENPIFDISSGIVYSPPTRTIFKSASIISYPNGWYRCVCTIVYSGTLDKPYFGLANSTTNFGNYTYAGNGFSGMYIWGAKLEYGTILTKYFPNSGVALDTIIQVSGTSNTKILKNFSGSGTFTESGTASQATAQVAFIPINTIILYNTNAITKLAMQYAGKSPTTPFGGLDIIFEELEANAPPQQFKYTGSASAPTTVKVSSTGILEISGTGSYTSNQASLVGSGSISLSGQHGVNVFNPNWITSGNIVVQSAAATNKQLTFSGSGSLPALISKLELLPITTTQYQHRTNVLSDITKYFRTNISSVTSATSIPNPVTGLTGDSAVYNVVTSSSGAVFPGYLDPRSSTGVFATNTTVFMSIFAKANTWGKFRLVAYSSVFGSSGALPNHEIQYDVSLGTATNLQGTNPPLDYGIVPYSNGWYRCWIKLNVRVASDQSGGSGWFQIKFSSDSSANNSMYWYGPQLQKDILTSFVENTTSAALTTTAYLDGGSDVDNSLTYADNDTLFFTTGGAAGIKAPNRHIGASPIAYYDPNEIVFGEGDNFYATEFKITSQSQYTRSNKPPESGGSLFAASGSSAAVLFKANDGTGLFTFSDGYSNLKATESWLGSGTINASNQASATVSFKANDGTGLFTFTNGYSNLNATSAWVGTGSTTLSGTASIKAINSHIGASPIAYYDPSEIVFGEGDNFYATQFKITSFQSQYRVIQGPTQYTASGSLFAIGGASQSTGFKPADGTGLFTISGQLGNNIFQPNWITSGTISISNQASAAVSFKPADGTGLFTFTNGYSNLKATESWLGSGTISISDQASAVVSFKPAGGTGLFTFAGSVAENRTSIILAGSGTITISGAYSNLTAASAWSGSGSATFTNGYSNLKATESWLGSGTITLSGAATTILKSLAIWSSSGSVTLSGSLVENRTSILPAGSGTISISNQASAAVLFRPVDGTGLFAFTNGYSNLKATNISVDGSGTTIFGGTAGIKAPNRHIGASPIAYYDPSEIVFGEGDIFYATEFKITSQSQYTKLNNPQSSGSLFVSNQASAAVLFRSADGTGLFTFTNGYSNLKATDAWLGSGTIDVNEQASARVTFKPADGTGLFTFTNGYSNLNATSAWVGTGTTTFSGAAGIKAPNRHIGASPIAYYDPNEIVFGEGDNFYATELKITSYQSQYRFIQGPTQYTTSGSLFAIGGASEAVRFKPADGTGLFTISGQLGNNIFQPNWITSGTISISNQASAVVLFRPADGTGLFTFTNGYSNLKATDAWLGSGTINVGEQATAAVSFKPAGGTGLFTFSDGYSNLNATTKPAAGSGTITTSGAYSNLTAASAWSGSGSVTLSGTAVTKQINVSIAFGTATFSGAATEKVVNKHIGASPFAYYDPNEIVFGEGDIFYATEFKITSQSQYTKLNNPQSSGSLFAASGASAVVSFKAVDGTGLFTFTNSAVLKQTNISIDGSGTIILSGAATLPLFAKYFGSGSVTLSGSLVESETNRPAAGSGTINASNQASATVLFRPVDGTGLFAFSGSAVDKHIDVATGSGTISSLSGGAERVAFKPADGTGLFTFTNGYSNLNVTSILIGTGSATLSGTAAIKAPNRHIGESPIAYYDPSEIVFGEGDIFYATEFKITSFQSLYRLIQGPASYQSSGSLFIEGTASEAIRFKPADGTGLFTISGQLGDNVFKPNWITSGTINTSNQASAVVSFKAVDGTGLFTFTNSAVLKQTNISIDGSGTISSLSGGAEKVTFKALNGTGLFAFTDGYSNLNATTRPAAGSGTITLSGAYSNFAAAFAWSGSGSVTLSGAAVQKHIDIASGSGTITLSGDAVLPLLAKYIGSGSVTLSGSLVESQTDRTSGSGTITLSGAYSNFAAASAWNGSGSITLSGAAGQKHIDIASGSGSISSLSGGAERVTFKPAEQTGLFIISGQHGDNVFKPNWITSGTISISNQSSAAVSFKAVDGTGLFTFTNSAVPKQTNIALDGSGTITLSGDARLPLFAKYSGSGSVTLSGSLVESETNRPAAGSGTINASNQASAAVSFKANDGTGLFTFTNGYSNLKATNISIDGSGSLFSSGFFSNLKVTFKSSGTGLFAFSGQHGDNVFKPNWITSGTISISNQAFAAVSFKAVDGTGLFTFTNSAVLKQTNISIDGSGSLFSSGFFSNLKVTFKEVSVTGLFSVSGSAVESETNRPAAGSGTINIGQQASAAVSFKANDGTGLFTFTNGYSNLKATDAWVGSGTATLSGSVVEKQRQVAVGSGSATLSGTVTESETNRPAAGSGTISISNQASAAVLFRPVDGTGLFTFTNGYSNLKATDAWVGSGSVTIDSTSTAKVVWVPSAGTGLFAVTGTAGIKLRDWIFVSPIVEFDPYELVINDDFVVTDIIKLYQRWNATNNVEGSSAVSSTNIHQSSGSLFTDSTASATVTFNPTEGDPFFVVSGSALDSHTEVAVASGAATISGSVAQSQTNLPAAGSGTINTSTLARAYAIVTFKPADGTGLFTFSGSLVESRTEVAIGSGTINVSNQSSAAVSFKATDGTGLFTFAGSVVENQTDITSGSGTIITSKLASARVTFKPEDGTGLFTFTGSVDEKQTEVAIGSGTVVISGNAIIPSLIKYSGSGTATISGTATESQTDRPAAGSGTISISEQASAKVTFKPADGTGLFAFSGSLVESQTEVAIGSGTISISNQASATVTFKPADGSGSITLSGISIEKHIDITSGSGTITTSNLASARVTFKPADGTGLFTISGQLGNNVFKPNWITSGTINVSNQASAAASFKPAEGTGLFTFTNGYSNLKASSAWLGSGTISISNQASAAVSFKPAEGTGLFTISGQLGNNIFKPNWIVSGTISISNQASAAVSFKTIDGTGLFTFSGSVVQSQINRTSGSGTINASNQASAKVTFKPAEGTGLFGISGSLVENRTSIIPAGSGTISISNQSSAAVSFKAVDGTGLFTFFNAAVAKQINVLIGSGTINASNQASAAVSFKPAGGTGLFSVSGSLGENQTNRTSGSGTIGISNQSSAAVSFKPAEGTGLFTFSDGYSNLKVSSAWLGSGSINASNQASAAVSFKPAEGTGLFAISGNANIIIESNYNGSGIQLFSYINNVIVYTTSKLPPFSGVTFVSGDSSNSTQYSNVGSGTINASDQASAKVTFSASSSTALFQISGQAIIKVPNYRGSGIINVGNQASAKVTFKPAGGTGLFTFSDGYSNLKITDAWLGSGSLFSIGSSPETRTFIWKTEPRQISYLFSGAAEYDKVSSYESTILLNISGSAKIKTVLPERIFATII